MDDRLRSAAHDARTEIESALDTETELARLHAAAAAGAPSTAAVVLPPVSRRRAPALLGAAAAMIAVVGGAIWLSSSDESITSSAPSTTGAPATSVSATRPSGSTTGPSVPTTTAPSTTTPTSTASTPTTSAPRSPVPPGTIDLGPDDLIARSVEGDVWWYPDALGTEPGERILLIDRDDPRQLPDEGPGPSYVDHVTGTFRGSLIYGDCCEPVSGNLLAIAEPGAEADLYADPVRESTIATLWGVGYSPRLEPGGSRVVAMNWDYLGVTDLATGEVESIMTSDAGPYGGYEAAWAGGSIAALVRSDEGGLLLSVRDPDDLATELDRVEILPPSDDFPAAGIVGGTPDRVTIYVRDDADLLHFVTVDAGSWTIVDEPLGFDVPTDATDINLDASGTLMTWAVGGAGVVQRRGEEPFTLDIGLAEIWLPEEAGAPGGDTTGSPITPVDWRELRWELTAVGRPCDDETEGVRCVQVIHAADGTMITYDRGTNVLTRHGTPPVTAALPEHYGDTSAVVAVGPEDVIYLQADPTVRNEEAMAIVAVSLTDGDAGRELARWDEARRFGPTQLVPAPDGLVECCQVGSTVPPPDAAVVVPWVDLAGSSVATTGPAITADIDGSTVTIRRVDVAGTRAWTVALRSDSALDGRSVRVTPTFDGGFITILYDADGTTIARGYADGRVDRVVLLGRSTIVGGVEAIDPSGRFLVQADAGAFARVDPFPDAAPTWGGTVEVDVEATGAIALPGIDEAIDAGPTWATDPVAFAAAVAGEPEVNEQRTIDATEQEGGGWTVTVTTSNLFDDSVFATRWQLVLRRDDTGSLRFVSGGWTQACQHDRGHQDFRAELCV